MGNFSVPLSQNLRSNDPENTLCDGIEIHFISICFGLIYRLAGY